MILPAQTIRRLQLVQPCAERTVYKGVTYGLGPAGYDLRLAAPVELIPGIPVLVDAVEHFDMPGDVIGFLTTKSTWARMHVRVANTVIEPGWRGYLCLEFTRHDYHTKPPLFIDKGVGVASVTFMRLEEPTEQPYAGKYQNQKPGTPAIFERRVLECTR